MKSSTKALLLSALVFPGAGHYSLKHYRHFAVIATLALGSLYFVFSKLMEQAEIIANKIQSGEIPLEVQAISTALHSQTFSGEVQQINMAFYALIFIWLYSIFDSYRLGLKLDKIKENEGTIKEIVKE